MSMRTLFLAAVLAMAYQQPPATNPAAVPPPTPVHKLTPIEEKMYAKMLAEHAGLEKKYPLRVMIRGTHATSFEPSQVLGSVGLFFGNFNYAMGVTFPIVDPGRKTVQLVVSAKWKDGGKLFSLYCASSEKGNCWDLPAGLYLAKKSSTMRYGEKFPALVIPMVVPEKVNIGGIYQTTVITGKYEIIPFDPERFRK